jgi:alkylresorcinol/alkylpyrone synthase
MSKIISAGTSDAKYELSQGDLKEFTHDLFHDSGVDIERMISVFDNSTISRRHITVPVEWLKHNHTFSERNSIFRENAVELASEAIEECLGKVNADYSDIDNIIFISSTGISAPTIDAELFNKLKLNSHIKRNPVWGLGCAGGAAGISRALEFTRAYPSKNALVAAVELCSLTFQKDDLSKSNIIAASLFSDGAAAALVCGSENKLAVHEGIKLIDSLSTIYPDSLDVMGWDIVNDGFKVIFSRDIPAIVKEYVHPNITELLNIHNLELSDLKHYITHPGGLKVINAYEESLGLTNGKLKYSRKVLNEHGNMSSPSVLYVLKEFLNEKKYNAGEFGLISALGPGFSSELVLFMTL